MLLFWLFISAAQAIVLSPGADFGHEELLMGGAGIARTGSTASITGNPALLGFVPQEELFTSTNLFTTYRIKNEGTTQNASPSIQPVYTGTTNRNSSGQWG